jgi:uncharacterized protein (DUF952 family)
LLQKTTFFVHTQISMLHWQSKEWSIPRSLCSTGSQKSGPYPDLYAPLAVKRVVHTQISLLHGGSQKSRRIVVATKDLHFSSIPRSLCSTGSQKSRRIVVATKDLHFSSIPRSLCSTGSQKSGPYPDLYAPLAVKRVVHTQISMLHWQSKE